MGMVFGTIDVEQAGFDVVSRTSTFEVRKYHPAVAVQTSGGVGESGNNRMFRSLAQYIGVFGTPTNAPRRKVAMTAPVVTDRKGEKVVMTAPVVTERKGEKVAMTAPVVTERKGEKVAMTAPVVTERKEGEKVAMTAPVVTTAAAKVETMQFILPSKYRRVEDAPVPTVAGVKLVQLPERTYAVLRYSGSTSFKDAEKRVGKLLPQLRSAGLAVRDEDDWQLYRYNPPFTLPFLRTNEVAVKVLLPAAGVAK